MRGSPVTVLCIDDHNLVRECMVAIIEQQPGLRVAGQARTVKGALDCFTETKPDVTLLSLQPRGLNCLQIIRAIRRADPRARIVVYARDESEAVYLALNAGAEGFVLKDAASADLVRVIKEVHGRNGVLLDDFRDKLEARGGLTTLTTREVELLELLTQGFRTKAIAASLGISDHTVKVHIRSVYEKLGVHGRAAALAEALRRGFVRLAAARPAAIVTRRRESPRVRPLRADGAPRLIATQHFGTFS
jgi:two-component system NarL family response regulator